MLIEAALKIALSNVTVSVLARPSIAAVIYELRAFCHVLPSLQLLRQEPGLASRGSSKVWTTSHFPRVCRRKRFTSHPLIVHLDQCEVARPRKGQSERQSDTHPLQHSKGADIPSATRRTLTSSLEATESGFSPSDWCPPPARRARVKAMTMKTLPPPNERVAQFHSRAPSALSGD